MPRRLLMLMVVASAGALVFVACLPADDAAPTSDAVAPVRGSGYDPTLGYTAKLEFKIVHPEETPTFYTHSTGGEFSIREDISEPNHEHSLQIDGTLTPVDDDGGVLLRYDVQTQHADLIEGFEAVHGVTGSALMTPGQSRTLTLLGDAALQVTVTRED